MSNQHFDIDPIYDHDTKNEVEIDSPFLQDITHNDVTSHTIEKEDHCFPMHEEGLLQIAGPIYDTNDDTNKGLAFPCLLKDPNSIATISMSSRLGHSRIITIIEDPFSSPRHCQG